jgi:excisionase family DNA binding protein
MNDTNTKRLAAAVSGLSETICQIISDQVQELVASTRDELRQQVQANKCEPFLTKKEMAAELHASVRALDGWMQRGIVPYYKIGRNVRFRSTEVHAVLERACQIRRY